MIPIKAQLMPVLAFYFDNENFYIFVPKKKSLF